MGPEPTAFARQANASPQAPAKPGLVALARPWLGLAMALTLLVVGAVAGPTAGQVPPERARPPLRSGATSEPEVRVARWHYPGGGDWYANPSSLPNWLREFAARTGIPAAREEAVVTLDSEDLYRYPLLYATGHGRIALDDQELEALRRWLEAGGFLWVDDNYGLDRSFREMVARLYPDEPLRPLGADHPIYRAYYRLPGLPKIHEHDGEPAQGFGVTRGGRLQVFYTWSSDIGDGLEDPDVHGDPAALREAAARMAVNVLHYALTHP